MRSNHNRRLMALGNNRIMPLVGFDGKYFINFGNYNFPDFDTHEARVDQVNVMPLFIDFWLRDKKAILMYRGLGNRG